MKKRLLLVLLLISLSPIAWSQCSTCTKTAAELDPKAAKGLNSGVLYLAAFPLSIIGTLGFIWWRHNKTNL